MFTAEGQSSIPAQGTKISHKPHGMAKEKRESTMRSVYGNTDLGIAQAAYSRSGILQRLALFLEL